MRLASSPGHLFILIIPYSTCRLKEEEREMQMRMEQQKHMYIRGQMPMQMPGMPPNMPGYPPQQLPQLQQQSQLPYMAQPPSYGNLFHLFSYLCLKFY